MLAIRLQRRGRKGDAFYRIIVQNARRHPSSGNIVRQIGTFNPHSKATTLNKDDAKFFLENGAQPSSRVARLLKGEGVKLPKWVEIEKKEKRAIRNPDKLRKNRPAEETSQAEAPADTASTSDNRSTDTSDNEVQEPKPEETVQTESDNKNSEKSDEKIDTEKK